ncbi:sigma 54-interacting transcriptional regulator [Acidicapsa dinghuensis]|uniref:Sigma 54-interacting transcriptional regulator n=1 Tax=Acidicapsa dinghuensis TaxID=2218256 RepID=A0ABW1EKJ6_9BACT|nr:sigma-54 dependent transcriptional regulator [Acidicapsa dinghuensis]
MIRIGLFSEDRTMQPILASALGRDFQLVFAAEEALMIERIEADECDVVLVDLNSNAISAGKRIEAARRLVSQPVPLVAMVDDGLRPTGADLVRQGAFGYCRRPPSIRDLKMMLRRAHENSSLKRQLQNVQQRFDEKSHCDGMIGSSTQMQKVYELVNCVADLNASVLVTGESGTGKELIARAIHNLGSRSSKPFVAVSCGAIPETLIESELFGHEKGAFTGSVGTREGFFEQAGDGTLFLDEIGELSLYTQVKLLRVLQQREFTRLGSSRLIPLRARLVFATHRDLGEMVAQGKFRQDLFYRINVMRIDAPPLQDRAEDIPQIATHLLDRYAEAYDKPVRGFRPEALAALQNYSWPGNVRELENIIQRAIIVCRGESIGLEDLPHNIREESNVVDIGDFHPAGSFERQLRDYKIKLAENAIRENHGNKTLAARSLCISRAYLHRLIRLADTEPIFEDEGQQIGTA